jgi:peptidoglycan/LPS O-acetylase OafA/YrhL
LPNKEESLRLSALRFPLIFGVVFIHAYETTVGLSNKIVGIAHTSIYVDLIRNLFSQELARTAVPTFFLMSGYLFFAGFEWSYKGYFDKLRRRTRTLLIPFLLWNIGTLLMIAIAQILPATQDYFTGKNVEHKLITTYSLLDYPEAILGIGRRPISYQFWFIRDLMVLDLLAPFIFLLNKRFPLLFLGCLFINWVFGYNSIPFLPAEGTFFFSLGCFLGYKGKSLFILDSHWKTIAIIYGLSLLFDMSLIHTPYSLSIHYICILLGVPIVLFVTKIIISSEALSKRVIALGGASFFVFAAHEPLLTIVRKIAYKILHPESNLLVLALYFILPLTIISLTTLAYYALNRLYPKFIAVITGGR